MKLIYASILISSLSFISCGGEKGPEEPQDESAGASALFSNKIDSIVYYSHETTDLLENEMVLEENDPALQECLLNYDFNRKAFGNLAYYFNSKKVYSKKDEIEKVNSYFTLKDYSEPDPESEVTVLFRDIFLIYSGGEIKGVVKVSFPGGVSAFSCFDKQYADQLMGEELKVIADTKGLEQYVTGMHRQQ